MSDFKLIESKWQKYWDKHPEIYQAKNKDDVTLKGLSHKKYILNEFPYPSGSGLHVGHAFSFVGGDVYARYKRMQGNNVLFPMGWDAFGLPTENYAIKMKRQPQEITKENTDMFRKQMKRLAFSFDWSREINTTDSNYYKWTQWIFIQLFKKGLAYKKEMPINWCPDCKIGLANEEVVDGRCERCGAEVSRRNISQWIVKITEYADKLVEGLEETNFIDKVKQSQINWIGKSEGALVKFLISDDKGEKKYLEVFTTRPDTLFGATFMVIAPEHELVKRLIGEAEISKTKKEEIENYVNSARKKSEMQRTEITTDKTGVSSGLYAINPVNKKKIPIWISDFVLASYGTGAIMSVPAHDERDFAFAKKFGLEIIPVVKPLGRDYDFNKEPYTDVDNGEIINSYLIDGMSPKDAFEKMVKWLENKKIGDKRASYHLRDWIFSRQHYWGEPIPMIFCEQCKRMFVSFSDIKFKEKVKEYCQKNNIDVKILENNPGWYPVEGKQLPIVLPEVDAYEPTNDGKSPLSKIESFVKCSCPLCGSEAKRETDTMPNWAGSDWYYLAYCFANKINNKANDIFGDIFSDSQKELEYWGPVDVYIGGDEHNVLHLLYSRFIYKFLWDLGVLPKEIKEPYYKRISHGVILGPDGQRMSKSKGNVIVPEVVADKYGVDVVRMYLMFIGPFDSTMSWNENTLMGVKRFLDRFDQFIRSQISLPERQKSDFNLHKEDNIASSNETKLIINKLIKGVTDDFESFKYNTMIAKIMEALNKISTDQSMISNEELEILIKLIAPMAPYTSEELWALFNNAEISKEYKSVHVASWPIAEEKYLIENTITVAVAVNGKVRDQLVVNSQKLQEKEEILKKAKDLESIKKWIGYSQIIKEIYVLGKMINFVVK